MKNLIKKLSYILYFVLTVVLFSSCGNRTPIIDGETPFIVEKIIKYNTTHSKYIARDMKSGEWSNNFQGNPAIILKTGLYQINDTIHFNGRQ